MFAGKCFHHGKPNVTERESEAEDRLTVKIQTTNKYSPMLPIGDQKQVVTKIGERLASLIDELLVPR